MARYRFPWAPTAAVMSVLLVSSGCSRPAEAPPAATGASPTSTSGSPVAQTPAGGEDLLALIPTPANTVKTRGPDTLADNGIHRYFEVSGAPTDVMTAFKTALEGKGWAVTTVTSSSDGEGGGATFTGNNGGVYGVFDGGGYQSTTYLEVCLWPTKPANPNCEHGTR